MKLCKWRIVDRALKFNQNQKISFVHKGGEVFSTCMYVTIIDSVTLKHPFGGPIRFLILFV